MNGPGVFLSHTWTDERAVDVIERALRERGLAVFRDKDVHLFDGVTGIVRRALESSAVMLAFYSRRYPVRYACQWALTRAFLAAGKLGRPGDRVLIVNPEPDDRHIVPVDFDEPGYFSWKSESDAGRLADAVAGKVERAVGRLGGVPDGSRQLDGRLPMPRRFAGRYPQMWSVHSELHGGPRQGTRQPGPRAAVIQARAGMGKTVLAEQYGLVFRDAYPGGLVWTSLAGADHVAGHFAAALSEVASKRFGLELSGMQPRQARAALAERITEDLLWVIDDVPEGLDPRTFEDLIVPSPKVHTLLTMRTAPPRWPGGVVTLTGLTTLEAEELIRARHPDLTGEQYEAMSGVVQGRQGHPLAIPPVLRRFRDTLGSGVVDDNRHSLVKDLADVVRACTSHAQFLLGFASVLAHVPISGEILVCGMSGLLGLQAPRLVADALDELDKHSLLHRVAGTVRQFWRLHPLVADAVRQDADRIMTCSFVERAARILANGLSEASLDICTHALTVASNALVPLPVRLSLVRAVAARHENHGDISAARDAWDLALAIARGKWRSEDVEAAARLALLAGETTTALRYTEMLIDRARAQRDVRSEFQARLIAAAAHDVLGDYRTANVVFHEHDLVREHGPIPAWLSEIDRCRAELAKAKSLWLRGEYRAARKMIDGCLPAMQQAHPYGTCTGTWPVVNVELARLQLLDGQVIDARKTARRVLSTFTHAGAARHHLAREAVAALAEGDLTVALPDMRAEPERWIHATKQVKRALDESTEWYGPDSPLTLELTVLQGRTLINNGEHGQALGVLAEAERRAAAVFGCDHPISLRARQLTGLATMGRKDWKAATAVFDQLLPRQDTVLGRGHPDSQLTRFQLGICLLKQNNLKRAKPFLNEATPAIREHHGLLLQWAAVLAVTTRTRVPGPLHRIIHFLEEGDRRKD